MKTRSVYLWLGIPVLAAVAVFLWIQSGDMTYSEDLASVDPVDIAAGEILYAENCATCHGVNLEGEEDWRTPREDGSLPTPPHDATGHTWHHPDSMLFTYTKQGGEATLAAQGIEFNSGMPGFSEQLSDEDIWNVLAFIKSTWPERESAAQADRTAQDIASQGDG